MARSGRLLEGWQPAFAGIPLFADLLFDGQSGLGRRLGLVALFGCRFGWRLEEITGDVVNDALLADMATARRVSIRTHRHLPSVKTAFPLLAERLPLYFDCLYVAI
jgi:hypothetical protein